MEKAISKVIVNYTSNIKKGDEFYIFNIFKNIIFYRGIQYISQKYIPSLNRPSSIPTSIKVPNNIISINY